MCYLFRTPCFPGCSAFLFLFLHTPGKFLLNLPDTALHYSTSPWVWKEVVAKRAPGLGLCTQLAKKFPARFEKCGTHGQRSPFLAHFT